MWVQFCVERAPPLLRLNRKIRDEVYEKIAHYGKVHYLWHGVKRIPVSFVPFGVSAVNFLGLSRLVANILRDTGMLKDAETKKAGISLAGQSLAKVVFLDNLGDLYQLTAAGTVVAGMHLLELPFPPFLQPQLGCADHWLPTAPS